jgi:hypothetical protein
MLIELQAIGPAGLHARISAHRQIERLLYAWHQQARQQQPGWPSVPDSRYACAVGAVHDLVFALIADPSGAGAVVSRQAALDAVLTLLEIPAER